MSKRRCHFALKSGGNRDSFSRKPLSGKALTSCHLTCSLRKLFAVFILLAGCPAGLTAGESSTKKRDLPQIRLYQDSDSNFVRLQIASQFQMLFSSKDRGSKMDRDNRTVMRLRALRPILGADLLRGRLAMKLQLNVVPGSFELLDAYFDYHPYENHQLRFGVFKTPLTRHRMESRLRLTHLDWAITSTYFGGERQWGFALHNGFERPPRWGYALGVFSGANSRASHGKGIALVYDEDLPNPSDLAGDGGTTEFHPELFIHVSLNANGIDVSSASDRVRTGLRYSVGFSAAWDLNPEQYADFSIRIAPEGLVKYRGLSLLGVCYAGWAEIGDCGADHLAMRGLLVEPAFRFSSRWELAGRYAVVDAEQKLIEAARNHAIDLGRDISPIVWSNHEEYAVSANFYVYEHNLKIRNGVQWVRSMIDRIDVTVQSEFQLSF